MGCRTRMAASRRIARIPGVRRLRSSGSSGRRRPVERPDGLRPRSRACADSMGAVSLLRCGRQHVSGHLPNHSWVHLLPAARLLRDIGRRFLARIEPFRPGDIHRRRSRDGIAAGNCRLRRAPPRLALSAELVGDTSNGHRNLALRDDDGCRRVGSVGMQGRLDLLRHDRRPQARAIPGFTTLGLRLEW
jgi:hypothetical protein